MTDVPRTHSAPDSAWPEVATAEFWEERYAGSGRVWTGKVNATLVDVVSTLAPGSALDLGCGEGGDAIWLARRGWRATGVDISPTAITRADEGARSAGIDDGSIRFVAGDASALDSGETYDLVTSSFLHSPAQRARIDILRGAAELVAPGGHFLVLSHAGPPSWSDTSAADHGMLSPEEEFAQLALDPDDWTTVLLEVRHREAVAPDGTPATVADGVTLLRRR